MNREEDGRIRKSPSFLFFLFLPTSSVFIPLKRAVFIFIFGGLCASLPLQAATPPQRIVSMNLCADEMLLRVARPEQILAVTEFSKTQESERALASHPAILKIHGTAEEVVGLQSDLIFVGPFANPETVVMMRKLKLSFQEMRIPKNFTEIREDLLLMGRLTGETERASLLARQLDASVELLKREELRVRSGKQDSHAKWKAIFYQRGGHVPGQGTFEDSILALAGVYNIAGDLGIRDFGTLSLEDLIVSHPDLILFPSDQKNSASVEQSVVSHPAIRKALPQVQVLQIPSALINCGSPASVDAVKMIQRKIYEN